MNTCQTTGRRWLAHILHFSNAINAVHVFKAPASLTRSLQIDCNVLLAYFATTWMNVPFY